MGEEGTNFYSNLSMLAQSVLFMENESVSIKKLIASIKKDYDLTFSTKEIDTLIEKDSSKNFIVQIDQGYKTIRLSQKAFERMSSLNDSKLLDDISDTFIEQNNEGLGFVRGDKKRIVKKALVDLFYGIFNSSTDGLKLFLDNKYDTVLKQIELSGISRRISLLFLKWENKDKEKFIYKFIKSSYDYCSLSMKNSAEGFKELFKTKKFILDTNIVLSLIGVNGKGLKEATDAFLKKSRDAGIEICYTNYTKEEIDKTIYGLVERLKAYQNLSYSIPEGKEDEIIDFYHVSDISSLYLDWCNEKPYDRIDNYTLFLEWLDRQITNAIFDLKLEYIDSSFESNNSKEINNGVNSLRVAKSVANIDIKMPSLRHDVINYLNIKSSRNKNTTNVSEQEYFFISQDNSLIEWAKKQEAGMPTFVVSPTIMYTILLRFHGRTADDFKAFNNYICLSIDYQCDESELFETRKQISSILSNTNEDQNKLKKVFVETNRIINQRLLNGQPIGEAKEIVDSAYDSVLTQAQEELEKNNLKHEEEMTLAKEESFKEGADSEKDKIIDHLADKYTKRWIAFKKVVIFLFSLLLLVGLAFIIIFFVNYAKTDTNTLNYSSLIVGIIGVVSPMVWFILSIVFKYVFKINFFDFNYDRIKKLEKVKAAKTYAKLAKPSNAN